MLEIHVMMPLTWSYSRDLMRGLRAFAEERGDCRLVWFPNIAQLGMRHRLHGPPDGIVAMVRANGEMRTLCDWRIPTVNVSGHFHRSSLPRVMPDQGAIGRLAAEHFLERGFEHFLFVGEPDEQYAVERGEAFAATVRERGFTCATASVDDCIAGRPFRKLVTPCGIMLSLDDHGAEVIGGCRAAGLTIPGQVALVGVNDDDVFCDFAEVPLSSVDPGMHRVGYEAGRTLADLVAGKKVEPDRSVSPLGVVLRTSSDCDARGDPVLGTALAYIRDHACDPMTVPDLLPHVGVSRRNLETRFLERFGRTLHDEIDRVRFDTAQRLLRETDLPLQEVCTRSGFGYLGRFSNRFREHFGLPPATFRRQYRGS